jgi:hypothetical protein
VIVVREVFSIEPDQMKRAKDLMREYQNMVKKLNHPKPRIMTDLVASHYTLVMETDFKDMAEFEKILDGAFSTPEWQAFYPSFRKLMRGGHREIYSLID